jgi:phosphate-selective porin OprO/OprP
VAEVSLRADWSLGRRSGAGHCRRAVRGWISGRVLHSERKWRYPTGLRHGCADRWSLLADDPPQITDTFTIRKVRPTLTGRIAKYFEFKIDPDFGNGTSVLVDAYLDVLFSPKFRVRSGKDKTPVGYELEVGDAYLLFPERSLASSLVPNRDLGVQVLGDLAGNTLHYDAGVFNGVPDGSSSTTDVDANSAKDLAGRIVLTPFRSTQSPDRPINGLGFQIGGSRGRETGALPTFRTSVQQAYFSYASGAAASGTRARVTPAVFYYYKAFGGYAEYMRSAQPVTRNGVETHVANHAWEGTASYLLTGDAASEGIVRPRHDFDPANGQWGALQLVARYTQLTIDPNAFIAGLASAGSSREARSFALGANWYPNAYVKMYGTFERTMFDGDVTDRRPAENVVLFRTQLAF